MNPRREYSPIDDGIIPIARDVERFGYLNGKDVIDTIRNNPTGLAGSITETSSRRANIMRRVDGHSVLDHTQSILELLHEWLILNRYDEASRQLIRRFESLVQSIAKWEQQAKDKIPKDCDHDNLTWLVGDSASQEFAEIQGEAQELNRFMRHMQSVLPRSGSAEPQIVLLQQIAPYTTRSVDWLKKKRKDPGFPDPSPCSTKRKLRFDYELVRKFLMDDAPEIGQLLPNRLPTTDSD